MSNNLSIYLKEKGINPSDTINAVKPAKQKTEKIEYHFDDEWNVSGGAKTKYHYNVEAIKTLQAIEKEGRYATKEEQKILSSTDAFLELCRTGESYSGYYFIEEILAESDAGQRKYALEGYLSPNTYEIYTSSSEDTIIKRLLSQTEAAYQISYDERAQELGMSMDEVFTLASMIEKEAKKADFAKVSAVFHNRLKQKMTLGSDVTIKYVSGSDKMVLGGSDLDVDSPYNTYKYKGLPIGPICNPSMDAVIAALYPDEQFLAQKYLYFCSTDPDSGSLHFSRTLEEHEAAVAMYRPLWEEYDKRRGL